MHVFTRSVRVWGSCAYKECKSVGSCAYKECKSVGSCMCLQGV